MIGAVSIEVASVAAVLTEAAAMAIAVTVTAATEGGATEAATRSLSAMPYLAGWHAKWVACFKAVAGKHVLV